LALQGWRSFVRQQEIETMRLEFPQEHIATPFLNGNQAALHLLGLFHHEQSQMLRHAINNAELHFNPIHLQAIIQRIEHLIAQLENLLGILKGDATRLGQMQPLFAAFEQRLPESIFKLFELR
jgi:hypothetical protein